MADPREILRRKRQRDRALFQLAFACVRMVSWTMLIVLFLVGVPFTTALFRSVAFVSVISAYANAATDGGAALAAWAAVVGTDARADVASAESNINARILRTVEAVERKLDGE